MNSKPESESQANIGEERYGAGDTYLVRDVLPLNEPDNAFKRLCDEVQWCRMSHRVPRLVAVQGTVEADGTIPVYRHPADASPPLHPFTRTVYHIVEHVSRYLPSGHPPLNHVLIQRYRTGGDYISEHSDKTIDILWGSCIVNVSLGAQRTMALRTKKNQMHAQPRRRSDNKHNHDGATNRTTQRIPLPHNSALVMGLETNREWLHAIRPDRRPDFQLSQPETAFGRERISLTFRSIGTFLTPALAGAGPTPGVRSNADASSKSTPNPPLTENVDAEKHQRAWLIWGQGAVSKTRDSAHPTSASGKERAALLHAFGKENHFANFVWDRAYGKGFDVLHFSESDTHS